MIRLNYDRDTKKVSVINVENQDLRQEYCHEDDFDGINIFSYKRYNKMMDLGAAQPVAQLGTDYLRGSDGVTPGAHTGTESTAATWWPSPTDTGSPTSIPWNGRRPPRTMWE